ncbi:MAG: type VI secretion system protein TssA [Nannocystaceae bacterium]
MDSPPSDADTNWTSALLKPIAAEAPAGEDAKYNPAHEEVREQVARLDSATAADVDWKRVGLLCHEILQNTSKDILIACYLVRAEHRRDGLAGLARGLDLVASLLDQYWETCFPALKRMRGRVSAIQWLVTQCGQLLEGAVVSETRRPAVASLRASADRLARVSRSQFAEHCPALGPLLEGIERMELSLPQPSETGEPPARPAATATRNDSAGAAEATAAPSTTAQTSAAQTSAADNLPGRDDPAANPTASTRQRARAWLDPIAANAPGGSDTQYHPDHEAAQAEVAKLEAVHSVPVDWRRVRALCDSALKHTGKHLLLASYLARSAYEIDGIEGLTTGFALVAELCDAFWDTLHPSAKRLRRRTNALTWLLEPVAARLADTTPKVGDQLVIGELAAATTRLASVVKARFDGQGPALRPLLEAVERLQLSVPKAVTATNQVQTAGAHDNRPASAQPSAQPGTSTTEPSPTASPNRRSARMPDLPTGDLGSADDAVAFLREQGAAMLAVATILRSADASNPTAYRLLRTGLYLHIEQAPPAVGFQTQIPAMPQAKRDKLQLIAANNKWLALLDETESEVRQFRFNLDLHRMSAQALSGLGHHGAAAAIAGEIAALLQRLPDLPGYEAIDGSPLADGATQDWLRTSVLAGSNDAQPGRASAGGPNEADLQALEQAHALKKEGKLDQAIVVLQQHVMQTACGRQRFVARMALAEFALVASQAKLALGLFAALAREAERMDLEKWEPQLAADCLGKLVDAQRSHRREAKLLASDTERAWEDLCRLDPAAAHRLAP